MIRTSKKIDGRSFQKYINQVAALKNKEQNRKQFMDLYDTINAIDQSESNSTFKKLGEVKAKKRAEEKVVETKKNDAAAKIQRLVRKAAKKYFLVDVLLYRGPDEDEVKSKTKFTAVKQKVIKKYGDVFIQYAKVQLSVKAPRVFPQN